MHDAVHTSAPRRVAWVFLALCLLGIGVSIELTRIHVFVHTDPEYHSVCAVSEGVNCETVAVSPYSVFAGLPVSVWGLAGYLLMGLLAAWSLTNRRLHPAWPCGLLLLLTVFSAGVSVVLAVISATRIDSLCLFCMASYAINAVLLVLCLVAIRYQGTAASGLLGADLRALLARPALVAPLVLGGAGAIWATQALVPAYWQTPGWLDLPALDYGSDEHGHHWIGAREPSLTIVEFSDYECPHCRAAHKAIRVLAAKHPDEIRLVHRHLPLDMACHPQLKRPFHARACEFALAAECADLQGRFWEMNDALFSIQETVRTEDVDPVDLAVRLGLNRLDFKRCLEQKTTAGRIEADLAAAMERKLRGTPSFLVGEELFVGRIPESEIERMLSEAR
jgi:uncharacterized membrane protein/predicted DsbA family dithiol-disulfide isomerase